MLDCFRSRLQRDATVLYSRWLRAERQGHTYAELLASTPSCSHHRISQGDPASLPSASCSRPGRRHGPNRRAWTGGAALLLLLQYHVQSRAKPFLLILRVCAAMVQPALCHSQLS